MSSLFDRRAGFPSSRAAWLTSASLHAAALAILAYLSWTTFGGSGRPRGTPSASDIELAFSDGDVARQEELPSATSSDAGGDVSGGRDGPAGVDDSLADQHELMGPVPTASGSGRLTSPPSPPPLLTFGGGLAPANSLAKAASPGRARARLGAAIESAVVTVFGAVGEGTKFVYLFDHSTSMTGAALAAAKRQLLASLEPLTSVHQFQIVFFNHEVQAWDLTGGQARVPFASPRNKDLAAQFVRHVTASGGTERLFALRRAIAFQPDVVFFLTDADDAMPAYDVADAIDRAQRHGTAIACIEFGEGPRQEFENFLTRIAAETGGDHVYVDVTDLDAW